jgi:putative ABC transport system permease protein
MRQLESRWGAQMILFDRRRLLASCAGMAIAVLVMFIELNLFLGILDSQAMIPSLVKGDLVVMNTARTNLHNWTDIDRVRLSQVAGLNDVAQVIPIYQGVMGLRDPEENAIRRILVLAFPPADDPFAIGNPDLIRESLQVPGTVLFDRLSRPIYGDVMQSQTLELDGESYRMGGTVAIGPDIVTDGNLVMSEGNWLQRFPADRPIMGVIRLKPDAAPDAQARIQAQMPADTIVMTPKQAWWRETWFTMRSAPIGILFGIGMIAGLVIGALTCYQILYNQIVDHAAQYATLKAMGFAPGFLRGIVLEQALLLSGGAFILGLGTAWLVLLYLAGQTALAVHIGAGSVLAILALEVAISIGSGLLALRQIAGADPAELY